MATPVPASKSAAPAPAALWIGRILSILVVLFMLFDAITKLLRLPFVVAATIKLGYSVDQVVVIGILGLIGAVLYAVPRTAVLGAVILTAYWGGAVATNVRAHLPLAGYILSPVYIGIVAWIALWLRHPHLRHHLPLRKSIQP